MAPPGGRGCWSSCALAPTGPRVSRRLSTSCCGYRAGHSSSPGASRGSSSTTSPVWSVTGIENRQRREGSNSMGRMTHSYSPESMHRPAVSSSCRRCWIPILIVVSGLAWRVAMDSNQNALALASPAPSTAARPCASWVLLRSSKRSTSAWRPSTPAPVLELNLKPWALFSNIWTCFVLSRVIEQRSPHRSWYHRESTMFR